MPDVKQDEWIVVHSSNLPLMGENQMLRKFKNTIEAVTPPIILRALKTKFGSYGFSGSYLNWKQAVKRSEGYDCENILEKVKGSMLKVKKGEAAYERDSVLFDEIEYSWPLLAALLWISSQHGNRLNLIDFGGSLGSSYFQNRQFFGHLNEFKWNIVEQKHFVECGIEYFEDANLSFYFNINHCMKYQQPNTILFLSVIQYIEDPYKLLEEVINHKFKYIIFDRTTFLESGDNRIAIQRVSSRINRASYPIWFFNTSEFIAFFTQRNYEIIAQFNCDENSNITTPIFKGYIFKNIAPES